MSITREEVEIGAKAAHAAVAHKRGGSFLPWEQTSEPKRDEFRVGARAAAEAMQSARGARIKANKARRGAK